jgi:hypothetical protein
MLPAEQGAFPHRSIKEVTMQTIADVKTLLFDVLESAFGTGEVSATQQLGVNMSNAVKRDGVTIIQNQNVEVYARIMPLMVRALKVCDALESRWDGQPAVHPEVRDDRLLPAPEEAVETDTDPIEACCAWLYENRIQWKDMQDLMKTRYLAHVIDRCRTKSEAARWLGVGSTYLCKLSKPGSS